MSMWKWNRSSQLAAAEQAYVDAEIGRLKLVSQRNRMDKREFQRELSAAWLHTVDALEILTALRKAEIAERLHVAAAQPERA